MTRHDARPLQGSHPATAGRVWLGLLLAMLLFAPPAAGQNAAQREEIAKLRAQVRQAGELFRDRKFKESGELIAAVQQGMDRLAEGQDAAVVKALEGIHESLKRAHALLELEGVRLPPLKDPARAMQPEPGPSAPPGDGPPSFVKHVAPMLVSKCGRCHIDNNRGMFSLTSYSVLMRGNNDGKVVFPKDADGSRLVEVIESGDMPRGGGKVSPEELAQLKAWILAGAEFDGENPDTPLPALTGVEPAPQVTVTATRATGKETVSFARDIAPVLARQCAGCHGNGQQTQGGFNLATFQPMLNGGDSGPPILPGKPQESLLIKKLKGEADGQRMPQGRDPLPEETISLISTWIAEGAAFDGPDLEQNIVEVAEVAQALAATHEELSAARATRAASQWNLGLPGVPSQQVESKNFLIVSDAPSGALEAYAERAEAIGERVAGLFGGPREPLVKGRITLFILQQRYDYGEFGKMVEQRDLPPGQRAHFRFDVVNAYAAMVRPEDDAAALEGQFTEQIAAVYLASLGAPTWFAAGGGRVAASRLVEDDPRPREWDDALPAVLAAMKKPDDGVELRLSPEQNLVANYSFVNFLMKDARRVQRVLALTREGADFYQAFSQTYRAGPAQLTPLWVRSR